MQRHSYRYAHFFTLCSKASAAFRNPYSCACIGIAREEHTIATETQNHTDFFTEHLCLLSVKICVSVAIKLYISTLDKHVCGLLIPNSG